MSRLRPVYVIYFSFSVSFSFLFNHNHLFFAHFVEYLLLFLDDNMDEENELFSNSKISAPT